MILVDLLLTAWSISATKHAEPTEIRYVRKKRHRVYLTPPPPKTEPTEQLEDGVAKFEENVIYIVTPIKEGSEVPSTATFCIRWEYLVGHVNIHPRCGPDLTPKRP